MNAFDILRYGRIITDDNYIASTSWMGLKSNIRIRTVYCCGRFYYIKMQDGEVTKVKELK